MRTPCANAAHESGSRETSTLKRKITHKLKILHRGKPHATRYIVDFTSTSRGKAPLASQQTHTCPYLGIVEKRPWKIPRTSPRRCSSSGDHHELCLDFSWGRRQWPQASRICCYRLRFSLWRPARRTLGIGGFEEACGHMRRPCR